MIELEERVSELETWTEGKGLIVRGAAGTFCSGSDLNAVRAISNPQVQAVYTTTSAATPIHIVSIYFNKNTSKAPW